GCMSLNISDSDPSVLVQTGSIEVQAGQEVEIFYAAPYAGPPNLVIDEWHNDCVLTDQQGNHFRIKNNNATWVRAVHWTARGQRAPKPEATNPSYAKDGMSEPKETTAVQPAAATQGPATQP